MFRNPRPVLVWGSLAWLAPCAPARRVTCGNTPVPCRSAGKCGEYVRKLGSRACSWGMPPPLTSTFAGGGGIERRRTTAPLTFCDTSRWTCSHAVSPAMGMGPPDARGLVSLDVVVDCSRDVVDAEGHARRRVEARATKSGVKSTCWCSWLGLVASSSSSWAAVWPSFRLGCRTEVSGTAAAAAKSMSS